MKMRKLCALLWALSAHAGISAHAEPHAGCSCDHMSSSFLQVQQQIKGKPCDCTNPFGAPKSSGEDVEVLYASQCHLTNDDLAFWRLTKTEINPNGLVLKESNAYAFDCTDCEKFNLACTAQVPITKGNCACFWKVDGADLIMEQLACLDCASQCMGTVKSFVTVDELEPVMTRGVCIQERDYVINEY